MEELNSAWVRMTKLLHALEAQANEMEQKMADVRALALSQPPTAPTAPELLKKSSQTIPTTLTVTEAKAHEERERPRSLSANLAGYSSLSGAKGRDDDIHITAAVSIAHKDGLSYDEHELVIPFNSTIDRVKRLIFQVVPQLHENRLDEFELSIDGEELMVEFNRFSELPAVRMAIASREPVMVEVQAKESKKKRNSKKKEKKAKGSKLHLSGGSKIMAKTLTPTLERRGAGTSVDSPGRSMLGLRPAAASPDLLLDRPGTPTRERRRDSDPRSFAASSRDLQRIVTATDDKTARGLSPTTQSPSGRGSGSFGSTELPAGRERSGSAIVVRDREKRTASDPSSDSGSLSPVPMTVAAQAAPEGRAATPTSPPAAKQLRESKSPRADSVEECRTGANTLSVHSSRRKEGHKRSHSSDSRETDIIVDLEFDALKGLVVGDLSLDLDLKLGSIKTNPNEGPTTHRRSSKHSSRGDDASDSASPSSGTRSHTTKHHKKLRSVSQSSRNNVRDMNARPSADKSKKAPRDAADDECQSLKLLLASLGPGTLSIPAVEPASSSAPALSLPAAKAKSKSRSGDSGHVRKQQTRERAASSKTIVVATANNNNKYNGNSVEVNDRVKELEEREKKLLEWEEQLFKEEMEREEKREAEVAIRAKAADELEREVCRREEAVADRERAVDDVLRQREKEIEQRLSEKVAEEVRKTFEARMLILVDWEERLRKQESDFREREVSRLGLKSVARYDELLQVGKERVVRMQCYVRRALARLRVHRALGDGPGRDLVMKQLKSRAGTLNEIMKSEAAYVQYLTVLMEAFAVPIRQKDVLRLDDQLCLFANIGSVLSLHRRFLADLKDRYASWPSQPMLGDLFCKYMKLFHEEYAVYVLSYHASIELLHRLKASPTKTAFLSFVEKTQSERSKHLRGLDLSSFLIMPVQRIPRYQILLATCVATQRLTPALQEVLANTPQGHADLPSLRTSLEKIRGLNESLNDKQTEADLLRRVQELERKKSESQTPLRRSKSMRALLFSLSKRRGSLTSDGDSQYGKHLTVNAIHRQPAKARAEPGSLLKVFVHQGKNLLPIGDDARTVPDPYCMITLSGQMLRTSVIEGTSDPQWNQDFTYNVTSVSDSLCVTCYDWNQSARTRPLGFIELPFSVIAEIAQGTAQWFRLLPVLKQGHGAFQATSSSSPSWASSTLATRLSASSASLRLTHQDSLVMPALRHGRASMPPTLQLSALPATSAGVESSPDGGVRPSPRPRRLTPYSVVPSTEMGASADDVEWLAEMEVQLSFALHQIDTAHTDVQSRKRCDSQSLALG